MQKIKLLLKFSDVYEKLGKVAIENRLAYCTKYGYQLVIDNKSFDKTIEYNWMKYDAIERNLHNCDWLMWSDADSYIMNDNICIEDFLQDENKNFVCSFFKMGNPALEGCRNLYTLHTGNFFIRNCEWSFEFLTKFKKQMVDSINNKEIMLDEHTLTYLYKNIPGYSEKFKLLKIDRLFTIPTTNLITSTDLPRYKLGDFIIHYVVPLSYDRKIEYAETFYEKCMQIWKKPLPINEELMMHPEFLYSVCGL